MLNLGTVKPGSTIRIPFTTFDKDDGSSITMTNYAAADILVYKDGSTTERASTSGYTATTDFDTKTGKHLAIIDLADNTTAGFWNAGSEYLVAIDAVTVDAVTTGGWIARFTIGYPNSMLDTTIATLASQTSFTLTAGPAEDNALVGHSAIIHDIASAVQLSRVIISAYTGSTKTVTLVAGPTFTAAAGDNISIMDMVPLQATTLGRTLDVSSTGEAGIDWANVGGATSTVALTNTTVGTVTTTTTATDLTNNMAKYMHGAVWVDTVNGAAGTSSYVNGIVSNPCSTIASAKTIADNLKIKRFWIQSGSSVTLGAAYVGYYFTGAGYTLDLGTRDVSKCIIERVEGLSGTGTTPTGEIVVYDSQLGTISIGEADFIRCHLMGTVTMTQATVPYRFHDCTGISSAKITFNAATQTAVLSNLSGVITIAGMTLASQTLYIDGNCDVTLDNTNTAGTVYIAGNVRLTNNGAGQTLNDSARWDEGQNITNVTGNVSGSVGSVTGAVGSVTGNVGGNVVGSVGSVTGAVGSVTGNVGGNVVGSVGSVTGAVGSVTGLTASDVGAIKTQTDKFVFTVANQVDANIQSINDTTIVGNGVSPKFGV